MHPFIACETAQNTQAEQTLANKHIHKNNTQRSSAYECSLVENIQIQVRTRLASGRFHFRTHMNQFQSYEQINTVRSGRRLQSLHMI